MKLSREYSFRAELEVAMGTPYSQITTVPSANEVAKLSREIPPPLVTEFLDDLSTRVDATQIVYGVTTEFGI
ncbi:MAG: hypothetical protein ACYC0V_06175 [Armatimonadota bacterium]